MSRRAGVVILVVAALAVYICRLDRAAGLYVDDAYYVVLAKALAQGDGYRLINAATRPIVPAFPPGFPILLAPVVAAFPAFPDNVVALKIVSVAAMFGVAALAFLYLRRYRDAPPIVAAAAAGVTLLMPASVFLATSTIMAEATFTLCQLALALYVERAARSGERRFAAAAGVAAGVTLLVRAAGIAGGVAAAAYLLRARPRFAAIFAAAALSVYTPWAVYDAMSGDASSDRLAHGGTIVYRYRELMTFRVGNQPGSGDAATGDVLQRVADNAVNIFGRDIGAQLFPSAYRGVEESGQEVFLVSGLQGFRATGMGTGWHVVAISLALSGVVMIGFVTACRRGSRFSELLVVATIAMVLLVPVPTYRYVLPLAPFLSFYFFVGVDTAVAVIRRQPPWEFNAAFRVAAACILLMFALDHAGYIVARGAGRATWSWSNDEVLAVTSWMRENTDAGGVATSNPGLVWLMTGRKTVALVNASTRWHEWYQHGIRHAVALHVAPKPSQRLGYRVAFESPRFRLWVVEIAPGMTKAD